MELSKKILSKENSDRAIKAVKRGKALLVDNMDVDVLDEYSARNIESIKLYLQNKKYKPMIDR